MLRNLSLFGGLLAVAACFPDLAQYEGEGDAGTTANGTTAASTPTSSTGTASTGASTTTTSTSTSGDGGSGAGNPTGGGDSTSNGGAAPSSSTDSSSSTGGGGGVVDPCLPPNGATGVQAGALVTGTSPVGGSYAFCMDQAEVTHASYRAFFLSVGDGEFDLADHYDTKPACDWKEPTAEALVPAFDDLLSGDWEATNHALRPIISVDYCDATAYCAWAGKRLCGGINGEEIAWKTNQLENEWFLACSHDAQRIYPYNADNEFDPDVELCNQGSPETTCDAYDATKCRTTDECTGWRQTWTQAEAATCAAFEPRILNLSGNVAEWVDVCAPYDGGGTAPSSGWYCETRGGSCPLDYYTSCYYSGTRVEDDADFKATNTGFRCCWDPAEG